MLLAAVALGFAEAMALTGLAERLEADLPLAPGGQAEMVVLALVAGADVAFVTDHVVRLVVVIVGAALDARHIRGDH